MKCSRSNITSWKGGQTLSSLFRILFRSAFARSPQLTDREIVCFQCNNTYVLYHGAITCQARNGVWTACIQVHEASDGTTMPHWLTWCVRRVADAFWLPFCLNALSAVDGLRGSRTIWHIIWRRVFSTIWLSSVTLLSPLRVLLVPCVRAFGYTYYDRLSLSVVG